MFTKQFTLRYIAVLFATILVGCTKDSAGYPLQTSTPVLTVTASPTNTSKPTISPPTIATPTLSTTPETAFQGSIAFTSISRKYLAIAILNLEDGSIKDLSANGADSISWSPDGQWIAFDGGIPPARQLDIYKIRIDGSEFTRLTNSPQGKSDVSWSPDGRFILFAYSNNGRPSDLALVDVNRHVSRLLTSTKGSERYPAWSPDGKRIACLYSEGFGSPQELWVMDADGENAKHLQDVPFASGSIDWSSTGEWIAYISGEKPNECGDIYVIRPDGSSNSRLTNLSGCATHVVWSPDGKYLAFVGRNEAVGNIMNWGWQIYVMDIDGHGIVAVTHEREWIIKDIDWAPVVATR